MLQSNHRPRLKTKHLQWLILKLHNNLNKIKITNRCSINNNNNMIIMITRTQTTTTSSSSSSSMIMINNMISRISIMTIISNTMISNIMTRITSSIMIRIISNITIKTTSTTSNTMIKIMTNSTMTRIMITIRTNSGISSSSSNLEIRPWSHRNVPPMLDHLWVIDHPWIDHLWAIDLQWIDHLWISHLWDLLLLNNSNRHKSLNRLKNKSRRLPLLSQLLWW